MATINVSINRILTKGAIEPPTVALYIADYYVRNFTLIANNVTLDKDGNVTMSPIPTIPIDTDNKYVLRAVNKSCGAEYEQPLILSAYCPEGYFLSSDGTLCVLEETVNATPPNYNASAVAKSNVAYTTCGSYIYSEGFALNGTGASTKIDPDYSFWHNLTADCENGNTSAGPLNRTGIWTENELSNQDVGYSICITKGVGENYFIGLGCDNRATVRINGETVIAQNAAALDTQYNVGGAPFKVWHIYPISSLLREGYNIIELIGHNDGGAAAFGAELYNNSAYDISHAFGYGDLNLIFSSKDYVGMPIVIGSDGLGYSCPEGYSLDACSSPYVCRRVATEPVQYG